ncbi:hypothetical protein PAECIP111891_02145 [Paenibacillus allorhizoplanae]|uniref:Uncharacterized protein n=1 Tax=Paenibacillus allorhizoplanae TaxID=2905648 RepID=A0ABM9C559_9BACL|nr:hypothetical protein PAECIP111891_02145 [Paenibacillus allorhizoplanae]
MEEEIKLYKSEARKLKIKRTKLYEFIEMQEEKKNSIDISYSNKFNVLQKDETKLDHLRKEFVSPFVLQIEQLNYEIGELNNQISDIEKNIQIHQQYLKIVDELTREEGHLDKIKQRISEIESNSNDKSSVITNLSTCFNWILENFNFPKLQDAYIKPKDYLPYIRGRKYNELGSLGAVTMITMAYYLSILICGTKEDNNHPGFLIIDSPRKNLGADSKIEDEEFKDEAIFNSIIKFFLLLDKEYKNDFQIIVINNGYPDFVSKDLIIKEFDGKGTKGLPYGLIDDIHNI